MGEEVQHPTFLSTTWGSPQPQGFSAGFRRTTSQPRFLAQAHLPLSPARVNADLGTTRRETQKVTCWLSVEPQLKSSSCPTPDPSLLLLCNTSNLTQADPHLSLSNPTEITLFAPFPVQEQHRPYPEPTPPRSRGEANNSAETGPGLPKWGLGRSSDMRVPQGPCGRKSGTPGRAQYSGSGKLVDNSSQEVSQVGGGVWESPSQKTTAVPGAMQEPRSQEAGRVMTALHPPDGVPV